MGDALMATGDRNTQDCNVGNRGDILKHAALIALGELMSPRAHLRYLETHAYRLVAPCDAERWRRELLSLGRHRAYERYVDLEKTWVEGGRYRCSVGLILDLLPGARLILAEQHGPTRQQLLAQLAEEGADHLVLDDAAAFGRLAGGRAGPSLALVDPFESVHEFWLSFCRGFGVLCGGHDALILAFQYNSGTVNWPDAPPGLALTMTVDDGRYHLASYATQAMREATRTALGALGWQGTAPVDGMEGRSQRLVGGRSGQRNAPTNDT